MYIPKFHPKDQNVSSNFQMFLSSNVNNNQQHYRRSTNQTNMREVQLLIFTGNKSSIRGGWEKNDISGINTLQPKQQ